jgi:hypothetical protein
MKQVFIDKLIVVQLVSKFSTLYATGKLIIMFTSFHFRSLPYLFFIDFDMQSFTSTVACEWN